MRTGLLDPLEFSLAGKRTPGGVKSSSIFHFRRSGCLASIALFLVDSTFFSVVESFVSETNSAMSCVPYLPWILECSLACVGSWSDLESDALVRSGLPEVLLVGIVLRLGEAHAAHSRRRPDGRVGACRSSLWPWAVVIEQSLQCAHAREAFASCVESVV